MTDRSTDRTAEPTAPDVRTVAAQPWELVALAVLSAVLLVLYLSGAYDLARSFGAGAFALILMTAAILVLRRDARVIWTPLFWFRITAAVYFGLGTLALLVMNPFTLATIKAFYPMQPQDIAKVTLVSSVGALATLAGAALAARNWRRQHGGSRLVAREEPAFDARAAMLAGGLWFFGVGAAIKYAIALPYQFGLLGGFIVPGALLSVSQCILVGLYLLASWCFRYRPAYAPVILGLLALEVIVGLAAFSKSNTIYPVVMVALAWVQQRPSMRRLILMAMVMIATYVSANPLVEDGRLALLKRHGTIAQGTLSERIEILTSDNSNYRRYSAFQGPLARISYANAASFAIYRYDTGRPVDSFKALYVVLIPRALWPNKPNLSNFGTDFNFLATGNDKSSSSPGLMAEAYWNKGWFGLVAIMSAIGVLLFHWGVFTLNVFFRGDFIFMPIVFFGMKIGSRVDGALVADIISTGVFTIVLYFALVTLKQLFTAPADALPAQARGRVLARRLPAQSAGRR